MAAIGCLSTAPGPCAWRSPPGPSPPPAIGGGTGRCLPHVGLSCSIDPHGRRLVPSVNASPCRADRLKMANRREAGTQSHGPHAGSRAAEQEVGRGGPAAPRVRGSAHARPITLRAVVAHAAHRQLALLPPRLPWPPGLIVLPEAASPSAPSLDRPPGVERGPLPLPEPETPCLAHRPGSVPPPRAGAVALTASQSGGQPPVRAVRHREVAGPERTRIFMTLASPSDRRNSGSARNDRKSRVS